MKRIYNYILFKVKSTKLVLFASILVLYQVAMLIYFISHNEKYNVYDFITSIFSYESLFYTITSLFLIMLYNIFDKKKIYNYLSIRFNSKLDIYIGNVLTAIIFSVGIVVFIDIISFLLGSFMSFSNTWSICFYNKMTFYDSELVKNIVSKLTPISFILVTNLFVVLYLLFMSLFFIVCNMIFKKRAVSFVLVIILNALNIGLDTGILSGFTFSRNIYIKNSKIIETRNISFITNKLLYWSILIIVMYLIGRILTIKRDCNYED